MTQSASRMRQSFTTDATPSGAELCPADKEATLFGFSEIALPALVPEAPSGAIADRLSRPRRPVVDCGDLPFVIRRDGSWYYRGTPINRKELVCLFASVLRRTEDGEFWLETPAERGRIVVEDTPFVAVELDWVGCGRNQRLTFRTNVDELVTADAAHPIRVGHDLLTCRPTPYLRVRAGAGYWPMEARICRAVYYELVALAEPGQVHGSDVLGVWSSGSFFPLGELPGD